LLQVVEVEVHFMVQVAVQVDFVLLLMQLVVVVL
jgi:hypothetical protein